MSVIDDSRKVLQDFIAPELRAVDARLAALEKRFEEAQTNIDKRFAAADKTEQERFAAADKIEQERFAAAYKAEQERFAAAERLAQERFERTLAEIRQLHTVHDLELRMAKIEALAGLGRPDVTSPEKPAA